MPSHRTGSVVTLILLACAGWNPCGAQGFVEHLDPPVVERGKTTRVTAVGTDLGKALGKDVDPLLTIRDAKGRFVAEGDNDPGLYFDCRFEHTFTAAGTYVVAVRDARFHGSEHGFYVLRMGRFPAARVAVPAAVVP